MGKLGLVSCFGLGLVIWVGGFELGGLSGVSLVGCLLNSVRVGWVGVGKGLKIMIG